MKPQSILLFLLSIFLILLGISVVFPQNGIVISEKYSLHFSSITEIFNPDEIEYADISTIIQKPTIEPIVEEIMDDSIISVIDTVIKEKKEIISGLKSNFNADSLKFSLQRIEYPNNDKSVLYPIFKELSTVSEKNELIRILHYGDSQIEGDRITSLLRNKLQTNFGGMGAGLISATAENNFALTIKHEQSDNWELVRPYGKGKNNTHNKKYGVLMNYSTFKKSNNNADEYSAWVKLKTTKISYNKARKFKQCMMFYRNTENPVSVNIFIKDSLIFSEELKISDNLNIAYWNFIDSPEELEIKFKGEGIPEIYAFSFDGLNGLAVDNIPMRGSSGLEFTNTDVEFLKNTYIRIGVKMLIVEFGVNVVPSLYDNYRYYQIGMYNQLVALKSMIPNLPIIVIGLSDMSQKVNNRYQSYPNIELIRDVQRNAAFKSGCAFWDMYEAMGGKNSMPSWVFSNPALAEKDFTHFNHKGSKIIAEMFYNSFMLDYNDYIKQYNKLMTME